MARRARHGRLVVRRVRPDETALLRGLRLRALADAPTAFGSTLEREEAFPPEVWEERAAHGAAGENRVTYVAESGNLWVGMATGRVEDLPVVRCELVGMYVEPGARGQGVGTALVEAVIGWARGRSAATLYLDVTSTNHAAIALYRRCGFRATGREKPLDHTPALSELEMMRDLSPG